jgi:hypothetical protein
MISHREPAEIGLFRMLMAHRWRVAAERQTVAACAGCSMFLTTN